MWLIDILGVQMMLSLLFTPILTISFLLIGILSAFYINELLLPSLQLEFLYLFVFIALFNNIIQFISVFYQFYLLLALSHNQYNLYITYYR